MSARGLRQTMADLHTWTGLVFGWLLFAVFLTGTLSYFRPEISQWTRPELRFTAGPEAAAMAAVRRLQETGTGARRWLIDLPGPRQPETRIAVWHDAGNAAGRPLFSREMLDAASGRPAQVRETEGGDFFYYFHFDLLMPGAAGRLLVGLAAMTMLVAIVSGVITHRRIFADFFTFRPGKGQRSWLDAHNALAVLGLPYHVMITYTGLITLMFLYLPWGLDRAYDGKRALFQTEASRGIGAPAATSRPAGLVDIVPLMRVAQDHWGGKPVGRINIYRPGDAAARIEMTADDAAHISHQRGRVVFDGVTGWLIEDDEAVSWPVVAERAMYGLHLGRFGGPAMRILFFVSGLAGTAMVATGLQLWLAKRRRETQVLHFGHGLVSRLNIAVIAGLPVAVVAFFWANRLLPATWPDRAEAEGICFFGIWLLMLAHAALRPPRRAWIEQCALGAAGFLLLPFLNAATTERSLMRSLAEADWVFAGFDLAALTSGLLLATLAAWLRRRR